MTWLHHWVQLEHPAACTLEEAQRYADRLREAGIEVSVVEAYSPSGQSLLTGRSEVSPPSQQLYVLRVPPEQLDAARGV
jgi:hypothetical protein